MLIRGKAIGKRDFLKSQKKSTDQGPEWLSPGLCSPMGRTQLLLKLLANTKHLLDKLSTCLEWNRNFESEYQLGFIPCSTAGYGEPAEMVKLSTNRHSVCVPSQGQANFSVMRETFLQWKKQEDFLTSYTGTVTNTVIILKCEEFRPKCWGVV